LVQLLVSDRRWLICESKDKKPAKAGFFVSRVLNALKCTESSGVLRDVIL